MTIVYYQTEECMKLEQVKESLEPKCSSCGGHIIARIDTNVRFPYQCAECGIFYQMLPPATSESFLASFKKIIQSITGEDEMNL